MAGRNVAQDTSYARRVRYQWEVPLRRSPGPPLPRTLPRSALEAARELVRNETAAARVRRHAERALALALRRYVPRSHRLSDRALIEHVARVVVRTRR